MAEPKVRARVPWLRLILILIVLGMTMANAAMNMLPTRIPTKQELQQEEQHEQIKLRRVRLTALMREGDQCRPHVAREIARTLVFDGRPADAYADDYARRCGGDDATIRRWAALHRRQELREARAPLAPLRREATL